MRPFITWDIFFRKVLRQSQKVHNVSCTCSCHRVMKGWGGSQGKNLDRKLSFLQCGTGWVNNVGPGASEVGVMGKGNSSAQEQGWIKQPEHQEKKQRKEIEREKKNYFRN